MDRFKKILLLIDQDEGADNTIKRAVNLARDNDAHITLVDVIKPINTPDEISSRFDVDINKVILQLRKEKLEKLAQANKPLHHKINVCMLSGINFIEIIKYVHKYKFDLLIKVATPSGLERKLFGSLDLHLLRKCPCPVLIDKPGSLPHYSNILAAVDLRSDRNGCDDQVTSLSISLAKRDDATVNFVHSYQLKGERIFREGQFHIPEIELNAMIEHQYQRHLKMMNELLKTFDYSADQDAIHVVKGEPAQCIHDTAENTGTDLIVMGTVARSGIPGFFIGNTAEELLQTTTHSVLAVKPVGFQSPVI